MPGAGFTVMLAGQARPDRLALKPYWGKPAVRHCREGDGNVGIIRSPVRAIALPDLPVRAARMEEIDAMVAAWTRQRSNDDVMAALTRAHVPCAPVRTAGEVINDAHLVERGMWVDVKHAKRGKTRVPISPIRLHGGPPATADRPATLLDHDTDRVLSELLGLTHDELAALHAAGVIEPVKS